MNEIESLRESLKTIRKKYGRDNIRVLKIIRKLKLLTNPNSVEYFDRNYFRNYGKTFN